MLPQLYILVLKRKIWSPGSGGTTAGSLAWRKALVNRDRSLLLLRCYRMRLLSTTLRSWTRHTGAYSPSGKMGIHLDPLWLNSTTFRRKWTFCEKLQLREPSSITTGGSTFTPITHPQCGLNGLPSTKSGGCCAAAPRSSMASRTRLYCG